MKRDYLKIFILRTVGNFLLLSALAGVVLTFAPAISAEVTFRYHQFIGQRFVVAGDIDPCTLDPKRWTQRERSQCNSLRSQWSLLPIKSAPPVLSIRPIDTDFGIVIPKIAANARVIAGVDPGKYDVYISALRQGVAHAAGSVYPGQIGNSFLFAHSVGNFWEVSRWNAVFYLLKELGPGDEVDIFYQGKRYIYVVYDKKVVEATDVRYLSAVANFPMLTLQTCWPPGTTLKRLLVFARLRS